MHIHNLVGSSKHKQQGSRERMPERDDTHDRPSAGDATLVAIASLLGPIAHLAVARGVTVAMVEESLRRAFVDASRQALLASGLPAHRLVSRISTSTGLTRREVARVSESLAQGVTAPGASLAAEVFTRWATDAKLPSPLKRAGPAPSFDALARSVTQDVHPRTLLDELVRLGMARIDDGGDTVSLRQNAYVPSGDEQQMLGFLAANVGDHLAGAVSNVMGQRARQFLDQAVFADELSAESLPHVHAFASSQWKRLLSEAVPLLEDRIEQDKLAGRAQDKRVRIGLYSYEDDMPTPDAGGKVAPPEKAAPKKSRKKADHG